RGLRSALAQPNLRTSAVLLAKTMRARGLSDTSRDRFSSQGGNGRRQRVSLGSRPGNRASALIRLVEDTVEAAMGVMAGTLAALQVIEGPVSGGSFGRRGPPGARIARDRHRCGVGRCRRTRRP